LNSKYCNQYVQPTLSLPVIFFSLYAILLDTFIEYYTIQIRRFFGCFFFRTTIHIISFYLKINRVKLIVMDLISSHYCGQGEYFHVLIGISHSRYGISNQQVPLIMIIAFLLCCSGM
jgi:hypothetical protein